MWAGAVVSGTASGDGRFPAWRGPNPLHHLLCLEERAPSARCRRVRRNNSNRSDTGTQGGLAGSAIPRHSCVSVVGNGAATPSSYLAPRPCFHGRRARAQPRCRLGTAAGCPTSQRRPRSGRSGITRQRGDGPHPELAGVQRRIVAVGEQLYGQGLRRSTSTGAKGPVISGSHHHRLRRQGRRDHRLGGS